MPVTTNLETVKISELAETSSPQGKQTLATNPRTNQSMALDLTAVYDATVNANNAATQAGLAATQAREAAQAADKAREDIQEDLAGKADLDEAKKYVNPSQLDPLYGYQTGAIMGKGLFNSSSPVLTSEIKDKPYTTALLIQTPRLPVTGNKFIYNEGAAGTSGFGATVFITGNNLIVAMRGTTIMSRSVPNETLCLVVISYSPNYCWVSINNNMTVIDDPDYSYQHNSERFIIGGMEATAVGDLLNFNVIAARRFNFAMTNTEMNVLWNNGHPELWRVLDIWRNIVHSQWPSGGFTASAGTWVQNNNATKITSNVSAANGFSGTFLRAINDTPGNLSVYNSWRISTPVELKFAQLVEFEYRSDGAVKATHGGAVLATFPANTGNAVTASYIAPAGQYTSLSMAGSEGTYLEIRTLRIMTLGCLLDLTPAGLLPTLWRDMSGQGNDVPYVPTSGNPTNVEFSYENVGYSDVLTGIVAPSIAPNFVGQTYIDTQNKNVYKAVGTSSAADWKNIS